MLDALLPGTKVCSRRERQRPHPPVQRAYPLGRREPLVGVWLSRQPSLGRPGGDLRPGGERQLAQDLGDVILYGALREVELRGYLTVGEPSRHQGRHLPLPST